jgi:hypothetical protein
MADALAETLEALGARARVQLALAAAFAAAALALAVFAGADPADTSSAAKRIAAPTAVSVTRFTEARSLVAKPGDTVDYINVRTDARLDAPVLATQPRGGILDGLGEWIDSTGKSWMLVRLADGREGYVSARVLAYPTIEPSPPPEPVAALMVPAPGPPTVARPSSVPHYQPRTSEPEVSCALPNGETQRETITRCRALDGVIL